MGNTKTFRAGRQGKVLSLKAQLRAERARNGYLEGSVLSLQAQLNATRMERPADLEEWIEAAVLDMDDEERADWDAMTLDERERFLDELGQRINTAKLLTEADVSQRPS